MGRTTITTLTAAALAFLLSSAAEAGPTLSGRSALGRRLAREKAAAAEQAAPADLAGKLQALRTARSDKDRIEALAAVVEELVARDATRQLCMASMMGQGMVSQGMMKVTGHEGGGMMGMGGGVMASCPMMGATTADAEGAPGATDHAAHHQ